MSEGIAILREQLAKTTIQDKAWIRNMEKSLEMLKKDNQAHFQFRVEYARELIEQKKVFEINGEKHHLQTIAYSTGKEKEDEFNELQKKSKKRKRTAATTKKTVATSGTAMPKKRGRKKKKQTNDAI